MLLMTPLLQAADAPAPTPLPPASADHLPRWRGFNLLEKFMQGNRKSPFLESDFQLISKLGFNFVRLPMDYRLWIKDGNWEQFDEATLKEIDQAVEWGNKYQVHVCINFHRAPGYTVANPPEKTSLWTDPETQRVCALHWATFAKRYKGISSDRLSFNLLNEPHSAKLEQFVAVITKLSEAIHKEDPDRLIISDGMEWGQKPVLELKGLHIAQAGRGYAPSQVSHYKANWMKGNENWPVPKWPTLTPLPGTLMAAQHKPEGPNSIVINGPFPAVATSLRLHVMTVSNAASLLIEADGQKLIEKSFKPGPGEGEWKKVVFVEKYKSYQNIYDKDYTIAVPAGAKQVTIRLADGDWLVVSEIGLKPEGSASEDTITCDNAWGKKAPPITYNPKNKSAPFEGMPAHDRQWLFDQNLKPWIAAREQGIGVVIGEWGAFNKTPHDVFLRWAEDNLANWKQADIGWAMWNFRGAFGVLDSGRADVKYEDYEGHKLDRALLELLLKY